MSWRNYHFIDREIDGEVYEMIVSQCLDLLPVFVNQVWDTDTLIH